MPSGQFLKMLPNVPRLPRWRNRCPTIMTPTHTLSRRHVLSAGLAAALPACGGDGPARVTPERLAQAIARLPGWVRAQMARTGLPGVAVAVVSGGATVYAQGFGVRELGRPEPVDADTVFQLASVSKSVGATVVASQVGRGRVGWDSRLRDLLPWFALQDASTTRELTVGDLYAHRSGLPEHGGDVLEDLGFDQRTVLERLRLLPLEPLRGGYAYTNFGLTAAALGVAGAAGQDWSALSEDALYRPLGMQRTSSRHADFVGRGNRAVGHVKSGAGWVPSLPGRQPDAQTPAGGVSSSVRDMARWLSMVLGQGRFEGRQVVAAEALRPALSPQIESSPANGQQAAGYYGYGFNVGRNADGQRVLSHSGAFLLGAGTSFFILPESDLAIVVLTNGLPLGVAEALCQMFLDSALHGEPQRDWPTLYAGAFAGLLAPMGALVGQPPPASPSPSGPLTQYLGVYRNDYYGPLEVALGADGQSLQYLLGPNRQPRPLRHWDGALFVSPVGGESQPPGSLSQLRFEGDRLTVEWLDGEGLGGFVRG